MIKFNRNKMLGLIAGAALLASTSVFAAEISDGDATTPGNYDFFLTMKPMAIMHMMDKGNKGFVTKAEYMKFHEEMWKRMDKNSDSKVSVEEWLGRQLRQSDGG